MRIELGLAIAFLVLWGGLVGCQQSTTENGLAIEDLPTVVPPTATLPRASPTRPASTATSAPPSTPNETETPEPTLEIPSATPLVPTPRADVRYRLAPWSADAANALIETLRAYPDGLGFFDRGYHDSGYYSASIYAAEAQAQALRRFPQSRWADSWTWDQAYRWALVGGPVGVDLYGQLIGAALKAGETDLARLPDWFAAHESVGYLHLELIAPPEPADPTLGSLIAITDGGSAGFLWISGWPKAVTVYPLHSSGDFGFSSADSAGAEWRDVTGDGRPEILTSHAFVPGSLDALTNHFDIFELTSGAPRQLTFEPELPLGHGRTLTVLEDGGPSLQFRFVFDSFSCPFEYTQTYRWTGQEFTKAAIEYPDAAVIQAASDAQCADILVDVLIHQLHDGDLDVVPSLQRLLTAWPYDTQPWPPNDDGAADVRDRARFLVGLTLALLDRPAEARAEIQAIVSTPVIPQSRWIAPGRAFIDAYRGTETLAEACLRSGVCADLLKPTDFAQMAARSGQPPAKILPALGLTVIAEGSVDLTGDGQFEDWAAVANGTGGSILFGFVRTPSPAVAVVLAHPAPESARTIRVETTEPGHSMLIYNTDDGPVYQTLVWEEGKLRVAYACTALEQKVADGYITLLEGGSAQTVFADLRGLEPELVERCGAPVDQRPYLLPRWLFVTALSAEWAQQPEAATLYLRLWREYPDSAYALVARAHLDPEP